MSQSWMRGLIFEAKSMAELVNVEVVISIPDAAL